MSNTTLEVVSTLAEDVAGALPPPWGDVVPEFIGDLLGFFFPPDNSTPSTVTLEQIVAAVSAIVAQQFTLNDIVQATSGIGATANTFASDTGPGVNVPFPSNINQALKDDPSGIFANLYIFLQNAVTGSDPTLLIDPMTSMATESTGDISPADSNLQAAFLPTFAYGVSTFLMLATYWVALAVSAQGPTVVASLPLQGAVDRLTGAPFFGQKGLIAYAAASSSAFLTLVQERLSQVGPATPFSYFADLDHQEFGVYFQDNGEPVTGFDPSGLTAVLDVIDSSGNVVQETVSWPGNLPLSQPGAPNVVYCVQNPNNTQQQTDAVAGVQSSYVSLLQQTIFNNYFDPGLMTQTIQQWNASVTKLQAAIAGTAGGSNTP